MSVILKNITLSVFINQLNLIMLGFLQNLLLRNIFLPFGKKIVQSMTQWNLLPILLQNKIKTHSHTQIEKNTNMEKEKNSDMIIY